MSFVSFEFILFVLAAVVLYYLLPKRFQWCLLLVAGWTFYLWGGLEPAIYLLFTTLTTYSAGILLGGLNGQTKAAPEKKDKLKKQKKLTVAAVLLLNFGLLFAVKYLSYVFELLAPILPESAAMPGLIMPLGISFYMFQSVGYVIDVYRGKYEPERNVLKFSLFVSFFPQIVQGPISRFDKLSSQLTGEHKFDAENIRGGIQLIMWGFFKKMVIADRAAVAVGGFFDSHEAYGGAVGAVAILLYCINLYCDFSGGIDITRGVAELFGIGLEENFRRPIFAKSLTEYWRRWHITLGGWMRDYVFYPISLSKPFVKLGKWARKHLGGKIGKIFATSMATFIVYLLIGIWHGANFKYIFYGFFNGAIITASILLSGVYHKAKTALRINDEGTLWSIFSMVRTWGIIFIGRYITRAPQLSAAFVMLGKLLPGQLLTSQIRGGAMLELGLTGGDYIVIAAATLIMLAVEWYGEYKGDVRETLNRQKPIVQWLGIVIPLLMILIFGIFRGDYIASEFIYKQY